jgi:hypothetical protein
MAEMMVLMVVDNMYREEVVLVEFVQLYHSMIMNDVVVDDDIDYNSKIYILTKLLKRQE